MADVHRVTIRLSPELYAQLEARGSHWQPLAAIIRDALEHYLSQQPPLPRLPEQPWTAEDTTTTLSAMAAMTARIDDLQAQVQHLTARLDALAAERQPAAATEQPRQSEQLQQLRQPRQS